MCIRDRGWRRVKAADALSGKENWVCDDPIRTYVKGTCSVSKLRGKKRSAKRPARRVRIGAPDGSLTALAGLAAVDEVTARLGIVGALDRGIGPIKQRADDPQPSRDFIDRSQPRQRGQRPVGRADPYTPRRTLGRSLLTT